MKFSILPIIFLCLLTACTQDRLTDEDIRARIVDIGSTSMGWVHGKWVILSSWVILTSRHVVEKCTSSMQKNASWIYSANWCAILFPDGRKVDIETIEFPGSSKDIVRVSYLSVWASWFSEISPKQKKWLTLGENIRAYTATGIIEGKILELDSSYIAYDTSLTWRLLSWSIVTDIILSPGESGMPIWTHSGELIWVMSAVDTVGKRSYIVE